MLNFVELLVVLVVLVAVGRRIYFQDNGNITPRAPPYGKKQKISSDPVSISL